MTSYGAAGSILSHRACRAQQHGVTPWGPAGAEGTAAKAGVRAWRGAQVRQGWPVAYAPHPGRWITPPSRANKGAQLSSAGWSAHHTADLSSPSRSWRLRTEPPQGLGTDLAVITELATRLLHGARFTAEAAHRVRGTQVAPRSQAGNNRLTSLKPPHGSIRAMNKPVGVGHSRPGNPTHGEKSAPPTRGRE